MDFSELHAVIGDDDSVKAIDIPVILCSSIISHDLMCFSAYSVQKS